MLHVIYSAGNLASSSYISIYNKNNIVQGVSTFFSIDAVDGSGGLFTPLATCVYRERLVFRSLVNQAYGVTTRGNIILWGNFNYDEINILSVSQEFFRVEIRNENGVLIADNGKPWPDGTYPPDAKNRTGRPLGMVNPNLMDELKNGLTGDLTSIEGVEE